MATTADNAVTATSPLLQLPAKLRNKIYSEVLIPQWPCVLVRRRQFGESGYTPPTLLQVCHQIREEARSIYYSSNIFRFPYRSGCADSVQWLEALEAKDSSVIKCIEPSSMAYCGDCVVDEFEAFFYMLKKTEVVLAEDTVKLTVWTYYYRGSSECCADGSCSGNVEYHRVTQKQLMSLIEKEEAAGP